MSPLRIFAVQYFQAITLKMNSKDCLHLKSLVNKMALNLVRPTWHCQVTKLRKRPNAPVRQGCGSWTPLPCPLMGLIYNLLYCKLNHGFNNKTRGKSPHYLRLRGFYFGDSNQILNDTSELY